MTDSKLGDLQVLYVSVNEIDPHPENANRGDVAAIKESMRINGYYAPILVQSSTGYILAGNHRYRAAKDLGYEVVPAIYIDVTDEEAKRIMVADNRTTRLGADDTEVLTALLEEIGESETGLLGTGYTHADLQTLLDAQDKFDESLLNEPDVESGHNIGDGEYQTEPIPGAAGVCTGVIVTRFDGEALSPDDYNKIRSSLGLGRAPRGALATSGIEKWA